MISNNVLPTMNHMVGRASISVPLQITDLTLQVPKILTYNLYFTLYAAWY
jgi:hypothetical protein